MTKEEMARAYADGYNKEYQQIAYDAFLCGYGAKCESVVSEDLEEAADRYSFKYSDFDTEDGGYNVYDHEKREAFIAGAEWQKVQDQKTIELAEDHAMLAGMNKMEQQMMEKAVEKYVHELYTDEEGYHCYISLGTEYAPGDKVRVIVINENDK